MAAEVRGRCVVNKLVEDSDWAADWWADDVAVVWATVVAVVSYSIFYMQAGPCNPWGLDSSNSSWLDPRDTSWVLYIELVLLLSVGAEEICEYWSLPHSTTYCTWWFLSMNLYYWVFHLHLVYLIYCTYALMVNKCYVCYLRSSCRKLFGKVRKLGKSVHTLIHPPSQCGCCVQQNLAIKCAFILHSRSKWISTISSRDHPKVTWGKQKERKRVKNLFILSWADWRKSWELKGEEH